MTTASDIALRVAKEVMDVVEGVATGGSTTTLADSVTLGALPNDHYNNGRLWIKSGTHAGEVYLITDFATTTGTVTFATVTGAIAAGVRYAITKPTYPYDQIISAITRALDSTWVTGIDHTLLGDGTTLSFTLPADVYDIKRVELEDPNTTGLPHYNSTHWHETSDGLLRFDYGYAPLDAWPIYIYYRDQHAELTAATTAISNEIELNWLTYKAAQELLWWGVGQYGSQVEYRIEERMSKVLEMLKGKSPRRVPDFVIKTAGAGG